MLVSEDVIAELIQALKDINYTLTIIADHLAPAPFEVKMGNGETVEGVTSIAEALSYISDAIDKKEIS